MSDRETRMAARRASADEARQRRVCVLVLGMHRSGTSALTRMLSIAGASLPANLMPAAKANPTGHWESLPLMRFHDKMLAELGARWDDWRAVEIGGLPIERRREIKAELSGLLQAEYRDAPLFVVKDPRICRFADLLLEVLDEATIDARAVLIVRNPIEVAESLERRDGISHVDAGLIWLRHMLDAEAATRGKRRAIVSYDGLLADWKACFQRIARQTGMIWPHAADDFAAEIERFLTIELRHHVRSTEEVLLDPLFRHWIADTYSAFLVLERKPNAAAALAKLDTIRREFEHATPILLRMREQQQTTEERLAEDLRQRDAAAQRLTETLGQRKAEAEELTEQLAGRDAAAQELTDKLGRRKAEAEELSVRLARRDAELEELKEQLGRRQTEVNGLKTALTQSAADRDARIAAAESRVTELTERLDRRDAELEELTEQVGLGRAEVTELKKALTQSLADRDARIAAAETRAKELSRSVEKVEDERKQLQIRLRAREDDIDRLKKSASWRLTAPLRKIGRSLPPVRSRIRRQQLRRDAALLAGSDLFDREFYLAENPDVAKAGVDPVLHYLDYGAGEGRNPSEKFDTRWYLTRYPDVSKALLNPLVHFIEYGAAGGRLPRRDHRTGERPSTQGAVPAPVGIGANKMSRPREDGCF